MGMFSWKTSDTNESIANVYSDRPVKPVYLLQPNGAPAIEEKAYQGYGKFGGVDAYEWLAKQNFGDESLRDVAINADCGGYHEDDKAIYLCRVHIREVDFRKVVAGITKPIIMFDTYISKLADGSTPNQNIQKGLWKCKPIALPYTLKFSFDPDACYEDLPASGSCEHQGFFYPECEDE